MQDWPRFSSAEILQLRKKTNLTRKALGELLKVPEQTVMRWESNAEEIPETANIVLCLIAKLGPDVFCKLNRVCARQLVSAH